MSRFIDADMVEYFKIFNPNKGEKTIADMAWRSDIDAIPTADVVEVVRCKDCKHYRASKATRYGRPKAKVCTRSAEFTVSEEDFCSFGERGEDAEIH